MSRPPCEGCAFGKNGAGKESYNSLRARVCALGAIPFGCHHGTNWEHQKIWTPAQTQAALRENGMCQGWRDEVKRLNSVGWYNEYREIRRIFAAQLLKLIDVFVSEKDKDKKRTTLSAMRKIMKFISKKDIAHEELPI